MRRFFPRSLLGQMLLSVALALLAAQTLSAVLLYRAGEQRRESEAVNALAFQLIADPRFDYRQSDRRIPGDEGPRRWRRVRVEHTDAYPLNKGEVHDQEREQLLRAVLVKQGVDPAELVVTKRVIRDDPYVMNHVRERHGADNPPDWIGNTLLVAGLREDGEKQYTVARVPLSDGEPRAIGSLIFQTFVLYVVLVGGLALLLRRITRPLAALTKRLEAFGASRSLDGQLEPSGPADTRRLISAHNDMEARIAALLDEKDVMLGAIGHDLKTPLASLRVRIENVTDAEERERMAASIEELTRSLDDILSLARVGRSAEPLERTDLAALAAAVVEEYEDMGQPVELDTTQRIALPIRGTLLRRALRNLIDNAIRYGHRARVSVEREDGAAVFMVADDGPGIDEDAIESMLEPFRRGEGSRSRTTGGAGLGLTLARAIAEQHGGSIRLVNRFGEGGRTEGLIAELRLPLD